MNTAAVRRAIALAPCFALVASFANAQGKLTQPKQGQGGSVVKGSAGTDGGTAGDGKDENGLEHCSKPMGAMAVVEPQSEYMMALSRYNLQSPVSLIRLMIQKSNCFLVVERGQGLRNMQQERALAGDGEMRSGANMGKGQMVAADFIMTPQVVFSEGNAGGIGGALGMFGGGKLGAVAGGLKFKEAQTTLLIADARSGIQVAAAEGSTKKADMKLGAGLFGGGFGAAAGGYGNTNEGKIIAASFMDNYNKVVTTVRGDESLQRNVGSLKEEAAAGGATKAGAVFNEGDVLVPKIANVKLLASPSATAKVVATLARGDELVVTGAAKDGYIQVQGASAGGWVQIVMVSKQ
jgi:hypothetical protein